MPDRNGLSSWAERDDLFHLRATLQAFERSYFDYKQDPAVFSKAEMWIKDLQKRKIGSVEQLAAECRKQLPSKTNTIMTTDNNKSRRSPLLFSTEELLLKSLSAFLPSPVGFQCYRLAQEAVERRENGMAIASYVHRGSKKGERWIITAPEGQTYALKENHQQHNDENPQQDGSCWTLDVDCAGYVRNVLKSITGSDFSMSLSDRDYMRAKDFFTYFERLEYTVKDVLRANPAEEEGEGEDDPLMTRLKWCLVDDLRSVVAGDIIVYRAKGGAAGGSVFTKKDCLRKALTAVKTAELYDTIDEETGDQHVDINVSKLPEVTEWVEDVMQILATVGIEEIDMLRGDNGGDNDEDNDDNLQVAISILEKEEKLSENTVSLLQEVLRSTNGNTGHIMFAAGPAEETAGSAEESKSHIWRVPVYHSTGVGPKSKRGIKRAYKRFEWSPKYERWTRGGPRDDVEGKHIEVVVGRMCV